MFLHLVPYYYEDKGANMQENLLKQRDTNLKSAQKYMQRYLQDLQKHFGLDNKQLVKILQMSLNTLKKDVKIKKWWNFF